MADESKPPAPFPPNDPLGEPLFGPTREATLAEMALVGAPSSDDEGEEVQGDLLSGAGDAAEAASEAAQAPPATAPPDPPAILARPATSPPAAREGGGEVIALRPTPEPRDLVRDLPKLILDTFTARNAKTTGDSYAGYLRRFLVWCAARGVDINTMPPNTAMTFVMEAYGNPISRNQCVNALRVAFETIASNGGSPLAPQEMVKTIRPPTPVKPAQNVAPRGVPLTAEPFVPPVRESAVTAAATESVSSVRATPTSASPKKGTSAVPSLGGRIRISKRVDGSEGLPGVPVGALVLVGDYAGHDLDGEGRIESFIANYVRPQYGPFYGQRPAVYYVDRLDNIGNPIPGSTLNVPIMPSPASETNPGVTQRPVPQIITGSGAVATGPQAPAPSAGITGDRFFDFFIAENKRREEEANKRIEELKITAKDKGMDPTMLMLLIDRVRPEPMDPAKVVAEAKRQGFLKPPAPPEPPPMAGPGPGGPFGGMDPFPEPRADPGMEALTVVLRQQGDMIAGLMGRMMQPAPAAPQMDLASIIALAKSLVPQPTPESAMSGKVMEALIARALAPPEKPKSIAETLKEIAALNEAKELLGGSPEEKPISFGEVIAAAIENAPAIGQAVATVLSSMPRAPMLNGTPQRRAGEVQTAPAIPPGRTPSAPLPKDAQVAFRALTTATGDQEIVDHIFGILTSFMQSGAEPWPRAANKLADDFKKCDTRVEIRAVATNLFVWAGAKRLMTDEIIERITTVLHTNYATIYSQLAPGQSKNLKDTEGPTPEAQAEAQAADAAAVEGQALSYENGPLIDTVGNAVVS